MRSRFRVPEKWTPEWQKEFNGELERALERLNEYALVPYGGTEGQVLVKSSDRPYVTEWADACCDEPDTGTGGNPTPVDVGEVENDCGTTTTLTPSAIAGLAVGDFMVWVCVTNRGGIRNSANAVLSVPTGWSLYMADLGTSGNANYSAGSTVFYRIATSTDLLGGTSYTASFVGGTSGRVCSIAYAFRNIHTSLPFGGLSVFEMNSEFDTISSATGTPVPIVASGQPIITLWGGLDGDAVTTWPLSGNTALGPTNDTEAEFNLDYIDDAYQFNFAVGKRISAVTEEENWIVGESATSSLLGEGWSYTNLQAVTMSGYHAKLSATTANARHYAEYEVTLESGQQYMFWYVMRGPWNTGGEGATGISYVDPSDNERGAIHQDNEGGQGFLDPLTDRNSVWYSRHLAQEEGGSPSTAGQIAILYFTAQESGVHKLRVNVASGTSWTFAGSGSENRSVRDVTFRRGWHTPSRCFTGDAAVMAGSYFGRAMGRGWLDRESEQMTYWAFSLNPAWDELPAATMESSQYTYGDANALADGEILYDVFPTSDDDFNRALASRPVMASIDGVTQRYYFEVGVLSSNNKFAVGVYLDGYHNGRDYTWNFANAEISDPLGNVVTPAIPSTATTGDVIGVLIDYTAKEISFYKNGTLAGTIDILDNYGVASTGSKYHVYAPLRAVGIGRAVSGGSGTTRAKLEFNLAGPFLHQPSNTIAYDWNGNPGIDIGESEATLAQVVDATFITSTDQTDLLPNSRQLVAGTNTTVDTGTAGQVKVNVTGAVLASTLTTDGDIFVRASGAVARLGIGSSGQVLTVSSGAPAWATPSGGGGVTGIYATSDQTKTSDTTLADDSVLVATLTANKKYKLEFDVYFDTAAAPDLKYDLNFTGTTTSVLTKAFHGVLATASLSAGTTTSSFSMWGASALNVVRTFTISGTDTVVLNFVVTIEVGASGGTFSLRWAQGTSSATAVTRRRDSCLIVTEIA